MRHVFTPRFDFRAFEDEQARTLRENYEDFERSLIKPYIRYKTDGDIPISGGGGLSIIPLVPDPDYPQSDFPDPASNAYTLPATGLYNLTLQVWFVNSGGTFRSAGVEVTRGSNVFYAAFVQPVSGAGQQIPIATAQPFLQAGDVLRPRARHDTGATMILRSAAGFTTHFEISAVGVT